MSGAAADTVHVCLRVCVCAATGVPVDRLGYFYESTPNARPQVSDEWVNRIGNGSLFHPPPSLKTAPGRYCDSEQNDDELLHFLQPTNATTTLLSKQCMRHLPYRQHAF